MAEEGWHARQTDLGRSILAALAASAAAPAALILVGSFPSGFEYPGLLLMVLVFGTLWGGGVALIHALLFGLPLYHLLSRRVTTRWWLCALGGAAVGGVPIPLLSIIAYSITVHEVAPLALVYGMAGAFGGSVFGLIMSRGRRLDRFS